ncbi:hypothetical protein GCM10009552_37470 [Rothia nasimurium]
MRASRRYEDKQSGIERGMSMPAYGRIVQVMFVYPRDPAVKGTGDSRICGIGCRTWNKCGRHFGMWERRQWNDDGGGRTGGGMQQGDGYSQGKVSMFHSQSFGVGVGRLRLPTSPGHDCR